MLTSLVAIVLVVFLATGLAHAMPARNRSAEDDEKESFVVNNGSSSSAGGDSEVVRSYLRQIINATATVNEFVYNFTQGTSAVDDGVELHARLTYQVDAGTDKEEIKVKELDLKLTREKKWYRAVARPKEADEAAGGKRVRRANGNRCGEDQSVVTKTVCKKDGVSFVCSVLSDEMKVPEGCLVITSICTQTFLASKVCDIVDYE